MDSILVERAVTYRDIIQKEMFERSNSILEIRRANNISAMYSVYGRIRVIKSALWIDTYAKRFLDRTSCKCGDSHLTDARWVGVCSFKVKGKEIDVRIFYDHFRCFRTMREQFSKHSDLNPLVEIILDLKPMVENMQSS